MDEDGWCFECHKFEIQMIMTRKWMKISRKISRPCTFSTVDGDYDNTGYTLYFDGI